MLRDKGSYRARWAGILLCVLILVSGTWAAAEDLAVTKTADKPMPVLGDVVTYTITLNNAGPLAVTARVTDLLPPGLAFSSAAPSQGTYDSVTGLWNVGSVKKNVLYTLSIQAIVTADAAGATIRNTATITYTSRTDSKRGNNSATAVIRVSPTRATITEVRAAESGGTIWVEWETALEEGTVGYYLRRVNAETGLREPVGGFVPGLPGSPQGGTYRVTDPGAAPGGTYEYWIEEVETRGGRRLWGPFAVTVEPEGSLQASGGGELLAVACAEEKGGAPAFERHERPVSAGKQERILARAAEQEAMQESLGTECGNQVKVFVEQDGLEYLGCSTLAGLLNLPESSVGPMISGGGLELRNNGQKATYIPACGGLYFYGQAPTNIYSDENVYWLSRGQNPAVRSVSLKVPSPASASLAFTDRLHVEQDRLATPAFFSDPEADAWMWSYLFGGFAGFDRMTVTTRVNGVAATGTATLVAHLFGGSSSGMSPEHRVTVWVNGTQVGEGAWAGVKPYDLGASFSQSLLTEGENFIEIRALLDVGVPYSVTYLDSLDLGYRRHYRAANNQLLFRRDANKVVTVSGFTSPTISVYDVSNPLSPAVVKGVRIDGSEGNYRVSLSPPSSTANYLAFTPDSVAAAAAAAARPPCGLTACSNKADYVVITPGELEAPAQALADYRQAQGHEARVVSLEDIYDAFNYGNASPWAIRRFLSHACYGWAHRPAYVVLAAEGTYDYKNHRGYGDNLLPTKVVNTPDGLGESDTWFADTSGEDGVPDIAIGRLPAATSAELQRLVDKIVAYEAASGDWASRVILAADNADSGGNFGADSDEIGLPVPAGHVVDKIYLNGSNALAARTALLAALNAGALLFNYIGHGVWDRLAQETLLGNAHADSLANGEKLPVAVAMTCSSGRYSMPGYDCLGEHLVLRQGGGAIGFWGPTGLSANDQAKRLDAGFFRARFQESETVLGDAVLRALDEYAAGGGDLYMLRIYNLLGDPALRVK